MLAACTMVFGPFGTIITFMLLPDDHSWRLRQSDGSDGQQEGMPSLEQRGHMRLLHLRLADTDINARFVIDERSNWDGFIAGCTERLRIDGVARVTDTSGENILTVRDLIHDDYVVVHATSHRHANGSSSPFCLVAAVSMPLYNDDVDSSGGGW